MKSTTRMFALLACLLMLIGLVGCGATEGEEVPAGKQIASCAGADYRLYVPTAWVVNTSYGVSGAYRDLGRQSTVSVNSYDKADYAAAMTEAGVSAEDSGAAIAWFWSSQCLEAVKVRALDEAVTEEEAPMATSLDGANAVQYHYSALIDGTTLELLQVVADGGERFYVFTFTGTREMFAACRADVNDMLSSFVFAEPYVPVDYAKQLDEKATAPAGMKVAFGKDVAYCFYVPEAWEIRLDDGIYGAYLPSDGSSVSVTPYLPAVENMSVGDYFAMSRSMMEKMAGAGGFTLISDSEKVDLGGRESTVFEFTWTIGGVTYHYRQYIAAYKSMLYSFTYTATETAYGAHLEDVERMVAEFRFR